MLILAWLSSFRFLFIAVSFSFILALSSCDIIAQKILTKPLVQIKGFTLTAEDFSKQLAFKLKTLDVLSAKNEKIVAVFKSQIVNEFIVSTLIDISIVENKILVSNDDVNNESAALISSYPSESAFREALAQSDISYSSWIKKLESGLKKKRLMEALAKKSVAAAPDELLSYYQNNLEKYMQRESLLLSHILIKDNNQADIVKKLLSKQMFFEVAKKYSAAYTLEAKDQYGWVEKNSFAHFDKLFKQNIGFISAPLVLADGIHIFKVLEKKQSKQLPYTDVASAVALEVETLRETARFTAWLDEQIKKYPIKKNLVMLDSIKIETQ